MVSIESTVKTSKDLVYTNLNGEAIILGLQSGKYFGLDEVGAIVWESIQKPAKISEIRDVILKKYQVERDCVERDLIDFIQDMEKEGLVEING